MVMGWRGGLVVVPGYPRTVTVTLVYRDTLTWGCMAGWIGGGPGISQDCHSYFGVPGYSDMGGGGGWVDWWWSRDILGLA